MIPLRNFPTFGTCPKKLMRDRCRSPVVAHAVMVCVVVDRTHALAYGMVGGSGYPSVHQKALRMSFLARPRRTLASSQATSVSALLFFEQCTANSIFRPLLFYFYLSNAPVSKTTLLYAPLPWSSQFGRKIKKTPPVLSICRLPFLVQEG